MFVGKFNIWIRAFLDDPTRTVSIPRDDAKWAEEMRKFLASEQLICLSIGCTDSPGEVVVAFSPRSQQVGFDPQGEIDTKEAFGFYVNASLASELKSLFGFIETTLKAERIRD